MYPMLRDGVSLRVEACGDDTDECCIVTNDRGKDYRVSPGLYRILKHADGTHPLKLSRRKRKALEKRRIITTSRFVFCGVINRYILFTIGRRVRIIRPQCRVINTILARASLPFFLSVSAYMALFGPEVYINSFQEVAYYALRVLSLTVHEAGHFFSGIALGYRVTDVGVLLLGILPIGAYVAHMDKPSAPPKAKIQMALAGIEANLLMAGLLLILGMCWDSMAATFVMAANINVALALLNALPVKGLDGGMALCYALGVKDISGFAQGILFSAPKRRALYAEGWAGMLCLALCFGVLLAGIVLILLVAYDVYSIAGLLIDWLSRFI